MTDGVKDNGLSLKGQTLTYPSPCPLNNPSLLLVFLVHSFMTQLLTADPIHSPAIGS